MTTQYNSKDAVDFLTGKRATPSGLTVDHIIKRFKQDDWENCHDHIQWCFPTDIASAFNMNAPVLNVTAMYNAISGMQGYSNYRMYKENTSLLSKSLRALYKGYFKSIGLDYRVLFRYSGWAPSIRQDTDSVILDKDRFIEAISHGNHNIRRITRVIYCQTLLGDYITGGKIPDNIPNALIYLANKVGVELDRDTLMYWHAAKTGSLKMLIEHGVLR